MYVLILPNKHQSINQMLYELEWPSLEARRDRSSLLFHKIHSGAVSIEKDKS